MKLRRFAVVALIGIAALLIVGFLYWQERERTYAINEELARELMYCGAFKLTVLQQQHKGNVEEFNMDPAVVVLRFRLIFASIGLGREDVRELTLEMNEKFVKDVKAEAGRMAQDPDALKTFFRGLRAKCDTLVASAVVDAAAKRGKAIGQAVLAKARKNEPTPSKKP